MNSMHRQLLPSPKDAILSAFLRTFTPNGHPMDVIKNTFEKIPISAFREPKSIKTEQIIAKLPFDVQEKWRNEYQNQDIVTRLERYTAQTPMSLFNLFLGSPYYHVEQGYDPEKEGSKWMKPFKLLLSSMTFVFNIATFVTEFLPKAAANLCKVGYLHAIRKYHTGGKQIGYGFLAGLAKVGQGFFNTLHFFGHAITSPKRAPLYAFKLGESFGKAIGKKITAPLIDSFGKKRGEKIAKRIGKTSAFIAGGFLGVLSTATTVAAYTAIGILAAPLIATVKALSSIAPVVKAITTYLAPIGTHVVAPIVGGISTVNAVAAAGAGFAAAAIASTIVPAADEAVKEVTSVAKQSSTTKKLLDGFSGNICVLRTRDRTTDDFLKWAKQYTQSKFGKPDLSKLILIFQNENKNKDSIKILLPGKNEFITLDISKLSNEIQEISNDLLKAVAIDEVGIGENEVLFTKLNCYLQKNINALGEQSKPAARQQTKKSDFREKSDLKKMKKSDFMEDTPRSKSYRV